MLRKRTRSHHKDQHMNPVLDSYFHLDISSQKHMNTSFLKVPGLFVGFNPKSSDSDSAISPISPLDFRIFSSFGNPFRRPRVSGSERPQKSWVCSKVGLSIIDSLDEEAKQSGPGSGVGSFDSKNILFGRQMSIKSLNLQGHVNFLKTAKSVSENIPVYPCTGVEQANLKKGDPDLVFEIGETPVEPEHACSFRCTQQGLKLISLVPQSATSSMSSVSGLLGGSLKSNSSPDGKLCSIPQPVHSKTSFVGSVLAREIELSEDYTCVTTHGPNQKVTHIFGDCILECHSSLTDFLNKSEDNNTIPEAGGLFDVLPLCPSNNFLKFCYYCQKKLDGEDIYMYRGEKAFCSYICQSQEIEVEEETEKLNCNSCEISNKSNSWEEVSKCRLSIAT